MSDWQLVSAYVQGDEQAFASLVQKYFPIVYSAAIRQVTDHQLAEEVAQSVFILFARKATKLSSDVLLTGWFLRTTRFVARDALKQLRRRLHREQQAAELAVMNQEWDQSWTALAPLVDEALLALSANEQIFVTARFIEGRSFREIGEQQRVTEDTAQKRVSRSLDKMRAFLERRGLKVAVTSIAGLLSVDFAHAAGPGLVETALSAVQAAVQGQAAAAKTVLLADAVARSLAWRAALKFGLSAAIGIALLGGGGGLVWYRTEPAMPASAPFRLSDSRIDTLASAWGRMAILAAKMLRAYPQRPAATDPRAAAYWRDADLLNRESPRIIAEFAAAFPEGATSSQLAEFLTVELRETVGLSQRQQAAVFALFKEELTREAARGNKPKALRSARAPLGTRINQWLSVRQRQRFEYTYAEDYRGLFTFLEFTPGK